MASKRGRRALPSCGTRAAGFTPHRHFCAAQGRMTLGEALCLGQLHVALV